MLDYLDDDLNLILDKTASIWDHLRDKTIFISGGTGFFGIWLQMSFIHANRKLSLNSKLIVLTRSKSKFLTKHPWIEKYNELCFLEGDITDFNFPEEKIDFIIHAATDASLKLNLEKPLLMFDTIVNGTRRILDFAKVNKVEGFLMTSSGAIYGKQPAEIDNLPESYNGAPLINDPGSVYGEGKRMAEVLCSVYEDNYGLPVKVARCYAFIGPFLPLDAHFAAGNFINNILNEEDIVIQGDGSPLRSYMYAADLVIWLWKILVKGKSNVRYNVGSNAAISILGLAQKIKKLNEGTQITVKMPPSGMKPLKYVPNIEKALAELDLKIYTNLDSALLKTIQFNKSFRDIAN
jgi:nucleoside-diphosphate-sugar epimerase